jgi:hypothetical protein
MAIALPHRDNARSLIAWSMGDDHQTAGEQPHGDQVFLPVVEAVVDEGDARPGEDLPGVLEAQPMFGEVAAVLWLRPTRISS